jgi:hypothetical protein
MEKISISMWILRIVVIYEFITSLIFLIISLRDGLNIGFYTIFGNTFLIYKIVEYTFYFILYSISLIGLFKKFNWVFFLIIGLSILNYITTIIEISSWDNPLEALLNPAFYSGILIIILAIHEYRQSKQSFTKNQRLSPSEQKPI